MYGIYFFDNTDLIVIENEGEIGEQVRQRQQEGVESWERALKFTGGALKATKCYWYLIDFQWKKGIWKYVDTEGTMCEIKGDGGKGKNI